MFKKILAVVLLICICCNAFALDMTKAEPYEEKEFPKWALDLRRSEIVFFGALPIAYPITALVVSKMNKDLGFWQTMGVAAGVSASIAVTDWILGLIKK